METTQMQPTNTEDGKKSTKITLVDLPKIKFDNSEGREVNADECSDLEFKEFVNRYIVISGPEVNAWPAEERRDVLNFILSVYNIHVNGFPFKFEEDKNASTSEQV
jgi:hypothetical protein